MDIDYFFFKYQLHYTLPSNYDIIKFRRIIKKKCLLLFVQFSPTSRNASYVFYIPAIQIFCVTYQYLINTLN